MANVRTRTLIQSHHGQTLEYQVPQGFVAVVHWITAFNANVAIPESWNLIHLESDITIAWGLIDRAAEGLEEQSKSLELRYQCPELQHLKWFADGDIDGTVTGWLLQLP